MVTDLVSMGGNAIAYIRLSIHLSVSTLSFPLNLVIFACLWLTTVACMDSKWGSNPPTLAKLRLNPKTLASRVVRAGG